LCALLLVRQRIWLYLPGSPVPGENGRPGVANVPTKHLTHETSGSGTVDPMPVIRQITGFPPWFLAFI